MPDDFCLDTLTHPSALLNSTSSWGCSSCRMMRISGQSRALEQDVGMRGLCWSSVTGGVSLSSGKKVRWSQSCPPTASSSLASAPTSHKIFGSNKIQLPREFIFKTYLHVCLFFLKRFLWATHFPTCVTFCFIFVFLRHAGSQTM